MKSIQILEPQVAQIPEGFLNFIGQKLEKNGDGGRPHFLAGMAKHRNPIDVTLDILELAWLKNRSIGSIARKFGTKYHTIYRLLQDLEPFKEELIHILKTVPRRKQFWNRSTNQSDFESVQAYINHARRKELKAWKQMLNMAETVWKRLGYRDPNNWTIDDVLDIIRPMPAGAQPNFVDAVRRICPQLREKSSPDYLETGMFREKIKRRKISIFGSELTLIHQCLDDKGLSWHKDVLDFHVTVGMREGSSNPKAGMCGISFNRFKKKFTVVDDFESKVTGAGITWEDCPVDLFFRDLPERLRQRWIERGKPRNEKLIKGGYSELLKIYKEIREALLDFYKDKLEPDLLEQFGKLKPHMADKIHCNLCWEAEIPLEVVAGEYIGKGEGIGLVGRGWLSLDTIKKYYLTLTRRSKKYQKMMNKVREYSAQFNGVHNLFERQDVNQPQRAALETPQDQLLTSTQQ